MHQYHPHLVPCACPPRPRRSSAGRGLGLAGTSGTGRAGWTAGWLTWRRRESIPPSATAALQLDLPAPFPARPPQVFLSCPPCLVRSRPVPVEIPTITCYCYHSLTPLHHYTTYQTLCLLTLPSISQCPRDIPPEPLARSLARSPVGSTTPRRRLLDRCILVQRPPSSCSASLSSRFHARPRCCSHSRYHQSS